jgi:hypothetical protein
LRELTLMETPEMKAHELKIWSWVQRRWDCFILKRNDTALIDSELRYFIKGRIAAILEYKDRRGSFTKGINTFDTVVLSAEKWGGGRKQARRLGCDFYFVIEVGECDIYAAKLTPLDFTYHHKDDAGLLKIIPNSGRTKNTRDFTGSRDVEDCVYVPVNWFDYWGKANVDIKGAQ